MKIEGFNLIGFKERLSKMSMLELIAMRDSFKDYKIMKGNKDITKDIIESINGALNMKVFTYELSKELGENINVTYHFSE